MKLLVFSSLYFISPAFLANMCPVFADKLNLPFAKPINEKKFGKNKTYRGFYVGYLGALLVLYIQQKLDLAEYSLLDYKNINIYLYAFLFGIGSIFGDMLKSFFKRKKGKTPGSCWFPFDQLDFVIMSLIFIYPFFEIPIEHILVLLIISPILHFITNVIAYFLKLKKVWW